MKVRQINRNLISVDKAEALRYLSYKSNNVDDETIKLLNESIAELNEISELKYVYEIFDIIKENDHIYFRNSLINIKSKDLQNLLKNSEKAVVMAATLGFEIEKKIKYYSLTNLSKCIIFDSCATSYIESLCDYAESEIKELAIKDGCSITFRFSPGYGDVPIELQESILTTLNAQRHIGLSVSNSSILIPRKSVTAFIGFSKDKDTNQKSCINCNLFGNCSYSKGGDRCVK